MSCIAQNPVCGEKIDLIEIDFRRPQRFKRSHHHREFDSRIDIHRFYLTSEFRFTVYLLTEGITLSTHLNSSYQSIKTRHSTNANHTVGCVTSVGVTHQSQCNHYSSQLQSRTPALLAQADRKICIIPSEVNPLLDGISNVGNI